MRLRVSGLGWIATGLALTLAACSGQVAEPAASATDPSVTAYTNARLWQGEGQFAPGTLYVREGVLVEAPANGAGTTVDLAGAFVIPALAEAHNHNLDIALGTRGVSDIYLSQGIFYVKSPNSVARFTPAAREKLAEAPVSVDATFSMGGITAPGGHPQRLYTEMLIQFPAYQGWAKEDFLGEAFHHAPTEADVSAALDMLQAQGADFVKTYLLHSDEYEARRDADVPLGMKGLSPEVYTLVVREAQSRGLRVSTHIESAADFRTAVAAGVDEINHLPGYYWSEGKDAQTYRLTPQDAQAAAAAGVVVVTTTGVSPQFYKAGSPELAALQALQVENLRTLHDAGVTLSIGSDNYMGTARNEVDNLIAIGAFTPSELLDLWVGTAKASVFPDRALSCLKPGCEASFLAMQADPSQDLAALKALSLRVKSGVTLP